MHGADAVYAGIPDFSLRTRINDFDFNKIKQATKYCHKKNKKIYITVNIFAHNKHIKKIPEYIKKLKIIKVDALIVSDPGIISIIKKYWKNCEIHLSTQANCTNWQSAKFWHNQGIKRIILGRETTIEEIKEIHKKVPKVELEYFIHGAMCMAYSGRCFLSKYYMNKSANLGDCVQPCRWKYIVAKGHKDKELKLIEEEHGSYILNAKDLCLLKYIKKMQKAGIVSFKIEGRAKSAYYQAVTSGIYSYLIKNINKISNNKLNFLYKELQTKIINRGYSTGFLFGDKSDQNIKNTHQKCNWEFCGIVIKKNDENNIIHIKVHNSIKINDIIEIILPYYKIEQIKIKKLINISKNIEIKKAHGGQNMIIGIKINKNIPKYSVLRRKLNK